MPLQNTVILENNVPVRLHFVADRYEKRVITSRDTGQPAIKEVLVLEVDEWNGQKVQAIFSTMAQKLDGLLGPYLPGKKYLDYDFIITQSGDQYTRNWNVQRLPRT